MPEERPSGKRAAWSAIAAVLVALSGESGHAAGEKETEDSVYVLRYDGIVCVRAPCPIWRAVDIGTCDVVTADSIDTGPVVDPDYREEWLRSWLAENPMTVRGHAEPDPGSEAVIFKVAKILGGPDPRTASCPPADVWRE